MRARSIGGLALVYLLALGASHVVRLAGQREPESAARTATVLVRAGEGGEPVRIADRELGPDGAPALLLLHGSPGRKEHLEGLAARLAERYRVLLVDLPGFGESTRALPDHSVRAQAAYLIDYLERRNEPAVHVVGYSMGGGVALELYAQAPERVRSLTMLSAIGVQELELLGDYHLNHLLHGLQLALLRGALIGLPHFGLLDRSMIGVPYARSFYDTDQRPLRGILSRFEPPMLILHGDDDGLVPAEAAFEHHRIVPHSELVRFASGHMLVFRAPERLAPPIADFVGRVEAGTAAVRADAEPERVAAAARRFDPSQAGGRSAITNGITMSLLAAATLLSEDLTCIGAGFLVAAGRIGFPSAVIACLVGIYVGDLLLYLAGRHLGRPIARRAPVRWFLGPERLEASAAWFARRGPAVIVISRFLPGARLPTYVAAGLLRTPLLTFSLWFLLAAGLWTPVIVGLSAATGAAGQAVLERMGWTERLLLALGLLVAVRFGALVVSHRGRRRLVGGWNRLVRWEFWPPWALYPPVVAYVLWLGVRFRGPTLFTAANPAMPLGGFLGESKGEILHRLERAGAPVARFLRLSAGAVPQQRIESAACFMARHGLGFPVMVKPDVGQRGAGVSIVRDRAELERRLRAAVSDLILQEYVPGIELGVFYYRMPRAERGRILSITEKRMPAVAGDGRRTLERLILDDPRAVCLARTYFRELAGRLAEIPALGEPVSLVEIGTHCRGAIFLDGERHRTLALESSVDRMSLPVSGFHFGRYDLRAPSFEAFREGRDLRIIELNGVTSEVTEIYDPRYGLLVAWRRLFAQWRLAFEIGAENRELGARPSSVPQLARSLVDWVTRGSLA